MSDRPRSQDPFIKLARFTDQTVIVTGAGSGIGRATALRVAQEGGRVVAVDIAAERLSDLVAEAAGGELITVAADITDAAEIARVVSAAGDRIDALANVAGVMDDMTPVGEVSDAVWERVFAVNVDAPMMLMRAVVPRMVEQGRGSVVNVASEASLRGSAAGVAYTASKHAVIGLTVSSAYMYGPSGIRVNAVAPGPVRTNIQTTWGSELGRQRVRASYPIIPSGVDADVLATPITFLLSDEGANINGVVLPSDGGWSAA
ncbi:SDR family NAD(P)-dependent oxidoreductase [Microbacterium sp. A93]|uniref:SDR family NAD(P)-dependent oxidoreductase n=1 Tax=Microbacterium sp. A93 TaxID=3450716 RepID=UPI003F43DB6D